jgi:amino acid adenylation domain-containing protein
LQTEDLSAVENAGELAQVRAEAVARRPFNLAEGGLLRALLLRLSPQEHVLVLVLHHIVCDGWSLGVLLREMGLLYTAYTQAQPSPLEPLRVQYADYALWQRRWLQGETLDAQLNYWRQRLANAPPALPLPTDRPRPAMQSFHGAQHTVMLPNSLRDGLRRIARSGDATLFMVLLAAFQVLLHKYTREDDILVGSAIAGRTHEEIEKLIGFFVNTIVLRTNLGGNPTFEQLLEQVRETCLEAYAHQDVPFEKLLEELQPERNLRHSPLFQVMFILQNEAFESFEWPGLKLQPSAMESVTAKFDLTLSMTELANGLSATLEYNTDLFDAGTAYRMLEHLRVLLESIVADATRRVSELPLLTMAERRQLVTEWSGPARAETGELCLHVLFEQQVARTPDALAVISGDTRLSYRELNGRANLLARELRKHGVGPDVPVALFTDRSVTMLVALLGILKAGGAYVPLDVASPSIRLAFMLEETRAPVIVTQEHLVHLLAEHDATVVCPSDDSWTSDALEPLVTSSNLAYVIFTSGSTGRPKGVQIEHRAVVNFLTSMRQRPGIADNDVLLALTTLSFDIALLELMLPLTAGACVALVDRETASDGAQLSKKLTEVGATLMQATPATWRLLLQAGWKPQNDFKILCGGEAWGRDLATQLLTPGSAVWNMYGPTETTIWSTVAEVKHGENSIPLGSPVRNTEVYVLDEEMEPVPVGVAGEVYIGGDGLARGYLNRPELTAERFVPNPFRDEPGARLYRTGDLARFLATGEIEYLGRMDQQLKVRGYRIEPGEIEARLCEHDSVREAVVVATEDASGDKRLVAYVVAREALLSGTLRTYLQERLTDYMVPSFFVVLDALPLNPNGKVDSTRSA